MTIATAKPLSDADLRNAANEGGVEFFDGELREKSVSVEATRVTAKMIILLGANAMQARAGQLFTELGYRCYVEDPRKFRKPDLSFVRAERLPTNLTELDLMPILADLAVEVISPNDSFNEVAKKVCEYLAAGFGTVWVVNPEKKSVRIHRADGSVRDRPAADEIDGDPFLPTFRCRVAAFFE